jgi:molybdate transport system regulatory protein
MATKRVKEELAAARGYRARGRVWIEGPDGTFLGYGRVVLLQRIQEHGSLSAAARSMDMSYRHAWKLVDSMNRQSRVPVVALSAGGRGGGGAVLTEAGQRAIDAFWSLWRGLETFLGDQTRALDL